jgi:hypothetical protein
VTTMLEAPKDDKFRRKYREATLRRNLAEKSDEEKRRHEKTTTAAGFHQKRKQCGQARSNQKRRSEANGQHRPETKLSGDPETPQSSRN